MDIPLIMDTTAVMMVPMRTKGHPANYVYYYYYYNNTTASSTTLVKTILCFH